MYLHFIFLNESYVSIKASGVKIQRFFSSVTSTQSKRSLNCQEVRHFMRDYLR